MEAMIIQWRNHQVEETFRGKEPSGLPGCYILHGFLDSLFSHIMKCSVFFSNVYSFIIYTLLIFSYLLSLKGQVRGRYKEEEKERDREGEREVERQGDRERNLALSSSHST